MAYQITGQVTVAWVGDGVGGMTVPGAQSLRVTVPLATVPGGDSPTGANFTTAATTFGTSLGVLLNASPTLGVMQGWSSGSP